MKKIMIMLAFTLAGIIVSGQATFKTNVTITKTTPTLYFNGTGGILDFNSNNMRLTHSTGVLTLSGGNFGVGSGSILGTGSLGATGGRFLKGWFTDLEITNLPTVGGVALKTALSLNNVTNESKATMFTNPTFTGTVSGITYSMVGAAAASHTQAQSTITNLSDSLLARYTKTQANTKLNLKVNIADTASMLDDYINKADTAGMLDTYIDITELNDMTDDLSSYAVMKADSAKRDGGYASYGDMVDGLASKVDMSMYAKDTTGIFNVLDFGAVGDGVADDTDAIQATIDAAGAYSYIYFPPGDYKVTSTIRIDQDRVNIKGAGKYVTDINFKPVSSDTLFVFKKRTANILVQCSLSDIGISSSGNTVEKIGIVLIDVDVFNLSNIVIYQFTNTAKSSQGLVLQGRDQIAIDKADFWTDRPVIFADNPNSTLDADHVSFTDCYLNNVNDSSPHPIVEVVSGINLSNITFDGYQAWVGGTYGFKWVDTGTGQISYNIAFNNIRHEQGLANSWGFYIDHNYGIRDLIFNNTLVNHAYNGFYIRKAKGVTFSNTGTWSSTAQDTCLDINSSVAVVSFNNALFSQGAVLKADSAIAKMGNYNRFVPTTTYPYIDSYYIPTVQNLSINPNPNATTPYSQISSPQTISMADGDTTIVGASTLSGFLFISETISYQTSAIFAISSTTITQVSDVTNTFSTTRDTPASFNIYWNADIGRYVLQNLIGYASKFVLVFIGNGEIMSP